MISATLRIHCGHDRLSEVNRLLRSLIEPTRVEAGCISCRLYHEEGEPTVITWVEEWQTEEDLKRHLKSPRYKKILVALDMAEAEPEIRFNTVVESKGMQLIEEARGVGKRR
jgi:quinol monooxygenase YgiN